MYYYKQKNFNKFKCIAKDCPENCCSFWQIMVDDESLDKYEKLAADDIRVKGALDVKDKCFRQTGGKCNFLETDGYCYLQRTYGESALCDTCRIYPRHVEEFENVREYTLTLSCPEAARMLLTDTSPMDFDQTEDDEEEEFEEFDYILYDKLVEAREKIKTLVRNRDIDICSRIAAVLAFAKELQEKLDDDDTFGMDEVNLVASKTFDFGSLKDISSVLFRLEPLHDDWPDILNGIWNKALADESHLTELKSAMERNAVPAEQILMFFINTYFCGAVYDGWVYSKAAIAVYSTVWIFCMLYACEETGNGSETGRDRASGKEASAGITILNNGEKVAGVPDFAEPAIYNETDSLIKAAWTYARETEHSDVNLDLLEDWFMDNM